MQIELSVPAAKGSVLMDGTRYAGRMSSDGMTMSVEGLPLLKTTSYSYSALGRRRRHGAADMVPRVCPRTGAARQGPVARRVDQAAQAEHGCPRGERSPWRLRAGDDHGLGGMRLEMKIQQTAPAAKPAEGETPAEEGDEAAKPAEKQPEAQIVELKQWRDFDGNVKSATRDFTLELKPEQFKPGQTVAVRAVAWDKRQVSLSIRS